MKRLVALCAVVLLGACSSDPSSEPTATRWALRDPILELPGATDEIPSDGSLPDGTYLGDLVEDPDAVGAPSFLLSQGWFADTCYERFATEIAAGEARCMNDIEIVPGPGTRAPLSASAPVLLTPQEYSESKHGVDTEVLATIARGAVPTDAPPTWQWVPCPFLLDVTDGTVVAAEQIWLP